MIPGTGGGARPGYDLGRMPSGHTHDAVTWFLVTPVALATWALTRDEIGAIVTASTFAFAGLMFSGDLDLRSKQYKRWGRARWIWKPYQWLVPHRSFLSHGILVGPALRLVYLVALALLLAALGVRVYTGHWQVPWDTLGFAGQAVARLDARGWALIVYALAGLWVGGASHTLADFGWSAIRRRA